MKIGNALLKGIKVAGQTLGGIVGYGLIAAAAGWKPGPTGSSVADTLIPLLWVTVGASAVSGVGAALARWSTYRPELDPNAPSSPVR